MTGRDHETYRDLAFQVPAGTARLTVDFTYGGQDAHSVIDLGLRDPVRFRGWSGGSKSRILVEDSRATPGYLPGPLPAGRWALILGVPNMRKGAQAPYVARIWFDPAKSKIQEPDQGPVKAGPGWYRGDLHTHSGHSDGKCPSDKGIMVACPVFLTLQAARDKGLDFIALSDHNTTSQNNSLQELAPYFDDLLILPAREITTFQGHANLFGPTGPLDFRLGSREVPDLSSLLDAAEASGGLVSINHPGLPSGEACMGCGWTAATDWSRIPAMEVVNGGSLSTFGPEGAFSGIKVWESRLNDGFHITAIGGSDNHNAAPGAGVPTSIGVPTTVIHAQDLTPAALLAAIAQGHVFIDVWGHGQIGLEVTAQAGDARAEMGDTLTVASGGRVDIQIRVLGAPSGAKISLAGPASASLEPWAAGLESPYGLKTVTLKATGVRTWLRVDVRGPDGKLLVIGNPIYFQSVQGQLDLARQPN